MDADERERERERKQMNGAGHISCREPDSMRQGVTDLVHLCLYEL